MEVKSHHTRDLEDINVSNEGPVLGSACISYNSHVEIDMNPIK